VSISFYMFSGLIALLVVLLAWALRDRKRSTAPSSTSFLPEDLNRSAVTHSMPIRQALASADLEFLASRGPGRLVRRVRGERRRIVLSYLTCLRGDLERLLRLARVIALLSPEVAAVQEFERLCLTVNFMWRYRLVWMRVWAGFAPLPQIDTLSNVLSGFSVRVETVMKQLGERAALAAEMASSPDRRSIHPA
jgi:hypothetical protein